MDNDITERLRFHGRLASETEAQCVARKNAEREESADEIERLRERLTDLHFSSLEQEQMSDG